MIRSYSFKIHLQTITICSKGSGMCLKCPSIKRIMLFYTGKKKCGLFPGAPWVTSCQNSQSPILVNCHDVTPGIFDW